MRDEPPGGTPTPKEDLIKKAREMLGPLYEEVEDIVEELAERAEKLGGDIPQKLLDMMWALEACSKQVPILTPGNDQTILVDVETYNDNDKKVVDIVFVYATGARLVLERKGDTCLWWIQKD